MRLSYLSEYVELLDAGSFSDAARSLNIAQPTLSKHVASLEREFGIHLVERWKSGVVPTDAGCALYVECLKIEAVMRHAREALDRLGAHPDCAEMNGGRIEGASEGTAPPDADGGPVALRRGRYAQHWGLVRRCGLSGIPAAVVLLFMQGEGLMEIGRELGISRDDAAQVLGDVYRRLNVRSRSDLLNLSYSILE